MEEIYSPPTLKNPHQSNIVSFNKINDNFNIINGAYSNDFIVIENSNKFSLQIKENQRLRSVLLLNNQKVNLSILDSAVIYTRTIRIINCENCFINIVDADIRRIELWDCKNITITLIGDQVQIENVCIIIHFNSKNIQIHYAEMIRDYVNLIFKNEVMNKVNVSNIKDSNQIVFVKCYKIPLFEVKVYDIKDIEFEERISWLKLMTKTVEFHNENIMIVMLI